MFQLFNQNMCLTNSTKAIGLGVMIAFATSCSKDPGDDKKPDDKKPITEYTQDSAVLSKAQRLEITKDGYRLSNSSGTPDAFNILASNDENRAGIPIKISYSGNDIRSNIQEIGERTDGAYIIVLKTGNFPLQLTPANNQNLLIDDANEKVYKSFKIETILQQRIYVENVANEEAAVDRLIDFTTNGKVAKIYEATSGGVPKQIFASGVTYKVNF